MQKSFLYEVFIPHLTGRMTRRRYWAGIVLWIFVGLAAASVTGTLYMEPLREEVWHALNLADWCALAWMQIAFLCFVVRRLHDLGHSGWWALSVLIPGLALLIIVVLGLIEGEARDNRWGPGWGTPRFATGSPVSGDAQLDALERLARLREQGALTEEEFAAQKARITGAGR